MKKVLIFVILASMMVSLCSCGKDNKTATTPKNNQNDDKLENVFLIASSENSSAEVFNNFRDSAEYGLNLSSQRTQLTDVGSTREHPLDGQKQLSYSHSNVTPKSSTSSDRGSFYSVYDYYVLDDEEIAFLHDSDLVCYYTKPYNPDESYSVMSESAVKEIANAFLLSIMPENVFSNFVYEGMNTDILGRYALLYKRYVCGYPTDETISIWIDRSGEVSGYNGLNVQKFDSVESNISKDQIEAAEQLLLSEIESLNLAEFSALDTNLTINSEGEVFVQIPFWYSVDGFTHGEIAYLQIN